MITNIDSYKTAISEMIDSDEKTFEKKYSASICGVACNELMTMYSLLNGISQTAIGESVSESTRGRDYGVRSVTKTEPILKRTSKGTFVRLKGKDENNEMSRMIKTRIVQFIYRYNVMNNSRMVDNTLRRYKFQ